MKRLQTDLSWTHLLVLIGGDLLVILSFVWVGRASHNLSLADLAASLGTALPFIIGWFSVTPWFGLYTAAVSRNWRRLSWRLLLAWAIAGSLALILRALFLGRPPLAGIMPTFALVSLGYIGGMALIWRLGYSWYQQREVTPKNQEMRSAES